MRYRRSWQGRIGRGRFLALGVGLMVVKCLLDAILCEALFGKPWQPLFYVSPVQWGFDYDARTAAQWLCIALAALPFLVLGLGLTVRRLRDAGLSPWWSVPFVVPAVNLCFFLVLVLLPGWREPGGGGPIAERPTPAPARRGFVPALAASLLVSLLVAALTQLSTHAFADYGGSLFLALPFLQGTFAGAFTGGYLRDAIGQFLLSVLFSGLLLLVIASEGLGCLVMAAPLWLSFGTVGAMLGCLLARELRDSRLRIAPAVMVVPLSMWLEPGLRPPATVFAVTTSLRVAAPPAVVWQHLVAFGELPPPTELVFRCGIAYPVRAEIRGEGRGAVRYCTFSTGSFVEPITDWDPPRALRFSVQECPQPMVEWNPFHEGVDAPHLHGFFTAQRGEFVLEPLPGGGTELRGTTWYSHRLWPEAYWALWSDALVRLIHRRVLEHIRAGAEQQARQRPR